MSYILEALKKADNERKQEGAPGLPPSHGNPPAFATRPRLRSGRALGSILLFLILAGGIYGYNSMPTGTPPAAERPADQEAVKVQPEPSEPSPPAKTVVGNQPDIDAKTLPRPRTIKSERRKSRPQIPAEPPAEKQSAEKIKTKPNDTLPFIHELPTEIRAGLPDLKLAGHAYSATPQKRMIIINGKILKEGDQIDPSSRLAEITWEGIIVESKGVRFKKNNQ